MRYKMEDTHIVDIDLLADGGSHWLLAVFDGHGGDEVALFLEQKFAQHVRSAVHLAQEKLVAIAAAGNGSACPAPINYCKILQESFASVDADLLRAAGYCRSDSGDVIEEDCATLTYEQRRLRESGSTAAVALVVDGKTLYCANCGDSETVLAKRRAELGGRKRALEEDATDWAVHCLSKLHKPSDAAEQERIEALGGYVCQVFGVWRVQGTLSVARSFGDFAVAKDGSKPLLLICSTPHVSGPHHLHAGDLLLLACDGLWDVASYAQAIDIAAKYQETSSETNSAERTDKRAQSVAHALVRSAIGERNSRDNVSVVALEMGAPGTLQPLILNSSSSAESADSESSTANDSF